MNDSSDFSSFHFLCVGAFAVLFSLAWPLAARAQEKPELQSANASAKSFCDPAIAAFDADLSKVAPGLDSFEKMLADAQAEQGKKDKAGSAQDGAPEVLAKAAMLKQVTKDQVTVAKAYRAEAAGALARAEAERDPAVAAVHFKDALAKLESARKLLAKAATTLSLPAQSAEAMARRIDVKDDWESLRQLRLVSGNLRDWDNAAARTATVAAPRDDRAFGNRRYDESTKTLVMANGTSINLHLLDRAISAAQGSAPRGPLLRQIVVPAPSGGAVLQPAPDLMRAMANRDIRHAVEAVGGVALDVTFELLSQAGFGDFAGGQGLAYVERPVMLSLSALYEKAKSYARSDRDWQNLPDELRYPAALGRIHGYVLDPVRKDVFVVGSGANQARDRIDIDALSVLLAAGWRDGLVPAVSLDPAPSDPSGPQYPRIVNVPPDSIVAKTMLDADYEMKRLTFGLRRARNAEFLAYPDLIKTSADAMQGASRFWFNPVPLRERAVKVSSSGRSVLFASRLQLLTESMSIENGAFVATGEVGPIERRVAESFTGAYAALAKSDDVQPPGIFHRLDALLDAVTLAALLRRAGVDYPVLDQISRLPYRRMAGEAAVPAWYSGLTTTIKLADSSRDYTISGGVEMQARLSRQAIDVRDDAAIGALERTADGFRGGREFAVAGPLPLSLLASVADANPERFRLAAIRALAVGDHAGASRAFAEITGRNPLDAEAWAHSASALASLGRHAEAHAAILRARGLDPGNPQVRALALDVALQADPTGNFAAYGRDAVRALSQEYVARAFGALAAGRGPQAYAFAEKALALADDSADAYLARAWARGGREPEAERRDILDALRLARRQARDPAGAPRLSLLLAVSAEQRIQRASRYQTGLRDRVSKGDVAFLITEMQRAAEEAQEARKLDDRQALAVAAEIRARAVRVGLLRDSGQTATTEPVRQLLNEGLGRFPNFPAMYMSKAVLALVEDRRVDAVSAIGEAIRLAPAAGETYVLRASLLADLGRCAEARADAARAESLHTAIGAADRQAISACR